MINTRIKSEYGCLSTASVPESLKEKRLAYL